MISPRRTAAFRPALNDKLEDRLVLSTVGRPHAVVHVLAKPQRAPLTGSAAGSLVPLPTPQGGSDHATPFIVQGKGQFAKLGAVKVSGTVTAGGFLAPRLSPINGQIKLFNNRGMITLQIKTSSPAATGSTSPVRTLTYTVVSTKGAFPKFQASGTGTMTATFGANSTFTLRLNKPMA